MTQKTYSQSARGVMITAQRVRQELASHGFNTAEDFDECFASIPCAGVDSTGLLKVYDAGDVMDWLGY